MLTTIREKTQGWIAGTILALLAIPFALWGVNSYFESDSKIVVARVGDQDISVDTFRTALEQQRQALQQQLGRAVDQKMFDSPEFKKRILDGLVDQQLSVLAAEASGYRMGDAELARQIRQIPDFQRDGQFDAKVYESVLRANGLTPRGFETRVRQDTIVRQVQAGFELSTFVTNADVDALVRVETQARSVSYVVVKPQTYLAHAVVEAKAVEDYYAAHADEFKTPERVRVDYLRLSARDIGAKLSITDDELQKAYAQDQERYTTPEQRKASHILIKLAPKASAEDEKKALEKIQDLRRQALAGADFATLAGKYSDDPGSKARGGDLGFVGRNSGLVKEFEDAMFALKKGEVSQPVRTPFGYHLIKLVDLKPQLRRTFAEVRSELETAARARKADEQFYELAERFRNLVYEQSDSLKPAADALGLQIEQSDWFGRGGGSGVAADSHVVAAAFDPEVLNQGRNSAAIEAGPNILVVVRLAAHQEAATQPLTAVRAQIEGLLKQRLAAQEAKRQSDELQAQLSAGASLGELAKKHGLIVAGGKPVTRRAPEGMDPQLLDAVYAAARPAADKPVVGSATVRDGYAVFVLTSVQDGDPQQASAETKSEARRILGERRGRDYYVSYRTGLRDTIKVKLYPDRL
jgi:peptidyl-prolyl cis-trans isomerase D